MSPGKRPMRNGRRAEYSSSTPITTSSTPRAINARPTVSAYSKLTQRALLIMLPDKKRSFVHARIHRHIEEADHHLFPALWAETDGILRVGIVRIAARVIEVSDGFQLRPRFERQRLGEAVRKLPIKVVRIHPKQRATFAIGRHDVVLEAFPPQVHMWKETQQQRVIGQRAPRRHAIIRMLRRNHETIVAQLQRDHAPSGHGLREDQAEARLIFSCM